MRQKVLNGFESKIFPTGKQADGKGIKILTLKLMIQRLSTVFAQLKAGNTPKNLLNELCQIIYSKQKKLLKKYLTI